MCRHYQALSWQFHGRFMARHGTSPMSYSRHFHVTFHGTLMAPQKTWLQTLSCHFRGAFMALATKISKLSQFNISCSCHSHVTFMVFSLILYKDKPYSCQIHVTLMALSLKLLDCHDSVYHIHVRSMSLSQSAESAMKLE